MPRKKPRIDRLVVFRWGLATLFAFALITQARLQVVDRRATLDKAEATHRFTMERKEVAKRGSILSADGKAMAEDDDTYSLVVQFDEVPESDGFFVDLSAATGIPASEFSQLAATGVVSRTWSQPMTPAQQKAVQAVKNRWRANGVSISPSGQRTYPLGPAASCIVGISSRTSKLGLEKSFNSLLSGKDGHTTGLVDRGGAFLPMRLTKDSVPKTNGKDVELTIDSELQTLATASIKQAVESNHAERGVVIVYDPHTGDLLAMANWPSFDPTGKGTDASTVVSDFNPNTMSRLEPGSMFKTLTLAKALDMGAIDTHWKGYCAGQFTVGKKVIHCSHGAHHDVDITKVIAESCNVSAASWALRIGRTEYFKYLDQLDVLSQPNIGLPNEKEGWFSRNDPAEQLQLANLGFGQAINVTPVRLASAFAMIGNGGVRMEPRLIRRVGNEARPPVSKGQMIKAETASEVMGCMEAVIQTDIGTGKTLRIPGYRMAGKTGTAQRIGKGKSGYVANFVGFVPAPNPKVMILVMVENPTGGKYYGADVAGPVFGIMARATIRRLGIAPTEPISPADLKAATKPAAEVLPTKPGAMVPNSDKTTKSDKAYESDKTHKSNKSHRTYPADEVKPRQLTQPRKATRATKAHKVHTRRPVVEANDGPPDNRPSSTRGRGRHPVPAQDRDNRD